MANKLSSCPYSLILLCTVSLMLGSSSHGQAPIPPPANPRLTDLFPHLSFDHDFSQIFGVPNIRIYNNGSNANITLDKSSGSGLASKNKYNYGFFSASIKLPAGFTSGVVVAFYMSNADQYPHNHDEIDIELLGHQNHKDWVTQTNMYGNGSVSTGREEKFKLWFDPTAQFHDYSIIWNSHHIVFLVDNIPVREVLNTEAMSPSYPSKPMSVYATIWDASDWATHGGKYPVDYKYAPFTASIGTVEMSGCLYHPGSGPTACSKPGSDPSQTDPVDGQDLITLSQQQIQGLRWARSRMMIYSYCRDKRRYKVLPPECTTQ